MKCDPNMTLDELAGTQVAGMLTAASAENLLRAEFPEVQAWMLWHMGPEPAERHLRAFTGEGMANRGEIGTWAWERVPCSYSNLGFWGGDTVRTQLGSGWLGLIRVTDAAGASFMLFSYLRADMTAGREYLVSTGDLGLLRRFADDVMSHFNKMMADERYLNINVIGGPDMRIDLYEDERICLPPSLQSDIETQALTFFANGDAYRQLGVPHRRGLLFTGEPGTGKTMMIRRLARMCHREFNIQCNYLAIRRETGMGDLAQFFHCGSSQNPAMLILEDLESLTMETRISRSALLAQLDGLEPRTGVLVLATANDPELVDRALVHRPSRFDRVWNFNLPSADLRLKYLQDILPEMPEAVLKAAADKTDNWSFAYLKEIKVTAGLMAVQEGAKELGASHFLKAFKLLKAQFKLGQKSHRMKVETSTPVGFDASDSVDPDDFE